MSTLTTGIRHGFSWQLLCLLLLALAPAMILTGCRAAQLQQDQDDFRLRLMQMQADQIMDNLVRCHLGLPFVHLDYGKITGTVTQQVSAGAADGQTVTDGRTISAAGLFAGASRSIVTAYNFTIGANQSKQLTVTAEPVLNQPTVYRAYLEYLAVDGSLMESPESPPAGAALLCHEFCGRFYWIPIEFRDEFRELALKTSALRGEAIEAPQFWETKILGIIDRTPGDEILAAGGIPVGRQWDLTAKFAGKVPNSDGSADVVIDGQIYRTQFLAIDELGEVKQNGSGPQMTDKLRLVYIHDYRSFGDIPAGEIKEEQHIPASPDVVAKSLAAQDIKLDLPRVRPPLSSTKDLLRSIEHEVELFRLDQLRQ